MIIDDRTVNLRRALPADAAPAADVWLRSFAAALPGVVRPRPTTRCTATSVSSSCRCARHGWRRRRAGASSVRWCWRTRSSAQLYLAPEWRGRGLGDRFVALAKERRPGGLSLWTFQVNGPAHRFYERHGFEAVEWTDGSRNEAREPDMRFVWRP
ncbi:GNAT family N-acetyltransferase [Streptomyces hirsutus]